MKSLLPSSSSSSLKIIFVEKVFVDKRNACLMLGFSFAIVHVCNTSIGIFGSHNSLKLN